MSMQAGMSWCTVLAHHARVARLAIKPRTPWGKVVTRELRAQS
jgi:hypothetical protein